MGSGWQESDVKSGTALELLCAPSGASHCSFWSTRCLFRFDFIRPSLSVVHHAGDKKHSRMGRSTQATTIRSEQQCHINGSALGTALIREYVAVVSSRRATSTRGADGVESVLRELLSAR